MQFTVSVLPQFSYHLENSTIFWSIMSFIIYSACSQFSIAWCICSHSSGIAYYVLFHYLDPDDFIGEIRTFDFPAIIPIVCRLFQIENDSIALEGEEGFNVMITAVSLEATIGEATSDITILDDDSQLQIWCIIYC